MDTQPLLPAPVSVSSSASTVSMSAKRPGAPPTEPARPAPERAEPALPAAAPPLALDHIAKIKSAMSGLQLRAPSWATAVPDDVLMAKLMAGLTPGSTSSQSAVAPPAPARPARATPAVAAGQPAPELESESAPARSAPGVNSFGRRAYQYLPWTCGACSLVNSTFPSICEVCETANPAYAPVPFSSAQVDGAELSLAQLQKLEPQLRLRMASKAELTKAQPTTAAMRSAPAPSAFSAHPVGRDANNDVPYAPLMATGRHGAGVFVAGTADAMNHEAKPTDFLFPSAARKPDGSAGGASSGGGAPAAEAMATPSAPTHTATTSTTATTAHTMGSAAAPKCSATIPARAPLSIADVVPAAHKPRLAPAVPPTSSGTLFFFFSPLNMKPKRSVASLSYMLLMRYCAVASPRRGGCARRGLG